ncbi:hypothetical protein BLA34_12645 [Ralstonia solanacearum]|nr:hypothetical protein BLA34_12645 [Ralstonia solanacearum]
MHGLFQLLFTLGLFALVAAMIRPALAAKFVATPTRKTILARVLPVLVVIAALSGATKPKIGEGSEADEGSDAQAYAASDMSAAKRDFLNTMGTARTILQRAQQSPQLNNGICGNAINELVGYMKSGSANDIGRAVRSGSPDTGYTIAATQLNNYISVTRNYCGVSAW